MLGRQSLIAGWSKNSQQPFQEAMDVATRKFRFTVKAVPAGFAFAAGLIARASYWHRSVRWTVLIWTERQAAQVKSRYRRAGVSLPLWPAGVPPGQPLDPGDRRSCLWVDRYAEMRPGCSCSLRGRPGCRRERERRSRGVVHAGAENRGCRSAG
jgi:hypothetical protein